MSRSNNTDIVNPAVRFFKWAGSEGKFKYFDKSRGVKGEDVIVNLPFTFLVLDRLHTITGFSDADQSGYWSNEVRDLKTEPFTVRTKKGIEAVGLYSELAGTLNKGAEYASSVYIAFNEGKKLCIGNVKLSGSAIGPWIDFCKGRELYKISVKCTKALPAKKGTTNYFIPVFEAGVVSAETDGKAIELDKIMQEYLSAYFKRNSSHEQMKEEEIDYAMEAAKQSIERGAGKLNALDVLEAEMEQETQTSTTVEKDEPLNDLPFIWILIPLLLSFIG